MFHRLPWESVSHDDFNRFVDQSTHVTRSFFIFNHCWKRWNLHLNQAVLILIEILRSWIGSPQAPNEARKLLFSITGKGGSKYGLGSGCHAEPRVGESIGSKHKDRNKLVKVEGRWNECEHPVPLNHQETEWVTAVPNRTLKWFGWFVSVRFLTNFCIWLEREWDSWSICTYRGDSICSGYGEFYLCLTYFRAFLLFSFWGCGWPLPRYQIFWRNTKFSE